MTRTTPALMIVKCLAGGHAAFIADEITREGETWHASGRWKWSTTSYSKHGTYSWPCRRVVEIRWGWAPR